MAANKLIIGHSKEKTKNENDLISREMDIGSESSSAINSEPVKEPIYENLWGNDNLILNWLNDEQLAERRLYTRAKFMQKLECRTILDHSDADPTLLKKPIPFMVIDISMGGIGIICESEFTVGTILVFDIMLDHIVYEIKCEVAYCFQSDSIFRAGLKLVDKDKDFIRHLKILVARLSLQSKYGASQDYQGVS